MGGFIHTGNVVPDPITVNGWTPASGTATVTGILSVTNRIDADTIRTRTAAGTFTLANQGNTQSLTMADSGALTATRGITAGAGLNEVDFTPAAAGGGGLANRGGFVGLSDTATGYPHFLLVSGSLSLRSTAGVETLVITRATGTVASSGGLAHAVSPVRTAAYTVTLADFLVRGDATGGAFTITLPAASAQTGAIFVFKATTATANVITIAAAGADLIDGAASTTLSVTRQTKTLISDGVSAWHIVGASL